MNIESTTAEDTQATTSSTIGDIFVAWVIFGGGWGAHVRVEVEDTPDARAAALDYFERMSSKASMHVDEDETSSGATFPDLIRFFYPTCEHGMDGRLCMGPDHFMSAEQERALWP